MMNENIERSETPFKIELMMLRPQRDSIHNSQFTIQ